MIEIIENKAQHLPNVTSLFIRIPIINKDIIDNVNQQQIYYYDKVNNIYEFPITRLYFLVNLLVDYDDIYFIPYKENERTLIKIDDYNFKIKPYQYQLDGINYGLNHSGWLLLDDQGLGKTMQMIYLAEVLHKLEKIEHCLIICGVNGLKYNWMNEIKKFSNLSAIILGETKTRSGKSTISSVTDRCAQLQDKIDEFFVITNLETLQSKDFLKSFKKSKNKFDIIILDEAHKAKSDTSKAAKTLLKLQSKHNIALTGTVITNNPENLYVPLKWTGNLFCTKSMFNKMYNVYGGFNNVQIIGYKNLDLLKNHLATCSLRRLKSDVLELPERTFEIEYVELDNKQRKFYEDVKKGILEELDLLPKDKKLTIMQEMTMNMRLRQITAYPNILTTESIPSAKLDRLEELVEQIISQGDKIVIFSTFKATVPEVIKRLNKYNPLKCTGDESDIEINNNINKFQNNNTNKIIVCTWQKLGTGVTLTAANYVIFIDTPWNDSDFKQACDRCYRIGQKKNTTVITLICKNTYDERVQEILETKENLSNYIIDDIKSNLIQINDI